MNNSFDSSNFKPTMFADCLANSKAIFQLIDRVFPVDSCRHYGVLPLQLTGSDLALGMLDPNKEESLKFVNSIARVFGYSLKLQLLDRQTLQIMLDSYLNSDRSQSQSSKPDQNQTVIDRSFDPNVSADKPIPRSRKLADSAPTIISQPDKSTSQSHTPQKLPDLPPDLDFLKDLDLTSQPANKPSQSQPDSAATLYEIPPEFRDRQAGNLDDKPTIIGANPAELLAQEKISGKESGIAFSEAQISDLIAETLGTVPQPGKTKPAIDFLPGLMPQLSWQKLLEQAFKHQSELIQLNLHRDRGSIITKKNESLQSTVEEVPLPIFCSLIDEIKRMARIPQNTTSHPKKVVLERFDRQERILLRIEFALQQSSGQRLLRRKSGETPRRLMAQGNARQDTTEPALTVGQVNVQILRDRTLRIYEQQQMDKVSEQALQLSQQLEKTLRKIQACFNSAELTNFKELQAVHHKIGHQLRMLDK